MSDIIRLLPDHVANQIAAGEVIQRPASVVKELLENSVDAGADRIVLTIQDAGRTLVQVNDNGSGMSANDARMCFERHATSKITNADDLFALRTKGFRGEAMASIAAIAHVELRTCLHDDPIGTRIYIEGSKVVAHEPCQTAKGTSIAVKNLFFNVPARRNFLKSDVVEFRNIMDEFHRVALAHPELAFSLFHNAEEVHVLKPGNLRQRIVGLFGPAFNEKLVPVQENTSLVRLTGFVGKPEFARKSRGEQFFFANDRYIRSTYLSHAVQSAYEDLLPEKSHAAYFIFMEVDPTWIDINIHPTKTEVKFGDEKALYAILRSSVRQALGQYNIAPSLDFDQETIFNIPSAPRHDVLHTHRPEMQRSAGMAAPTATGSAPMRQHAEPADWQALYDVLRGHAPESPDGAPMAPRLVQSRMDLAEDTDRRPVQVHGHLIMASIRSGIMLIDMRRALERVTYERLIRSLALNEPPAQQQLFPVQFELRPSDAALLNILMDDIRVLGIDISSLGQGSFAVNGIAAHIPEADVVQVVSEMLADHAETNGNTGNQTREKLARAMALRAAQRSVRPMATSELQGLIDELFGCDMPYSTPSGRPTLITIGLDELGRRFQ
jgi:DNA mismatch repair protein MutL